MLHLIELLLTQTDEEADRDQEAHDLGDREGIPHHDHVHLGEDERHGEQNDQLAAYGHDHAVHALADRLEQRTEHNAAGGEIYAIRTEKTYPAGYIDTTKEGKKEIAAGERPAIREPFPAAEEYDAPFELLRLDLHLLLDSLKNLGYLIQ